MGARTPVLAALCAIATLGIHGRSTAQTAPITVERFGLFVVSDDPGRAAAFYQRIFGSPKVRVPGMVGFEVAEGFYAIVDRATFARTALRGDTTRGYMKVADIRATYQQIATAMPDNLQGPVVTEGRFSFFRMRDPDGNRIEFHAVRPS